VVSEAFLALVAAGEWGVSGFLSKLSAERNGPTPTLVAAQLTGAALVGVASLAMGEAFWDPAVVLPIIALGWLNVTGFWALYRALKEGQLAVVEPLVSTSPALTVLLAVVILQEALSVEGWLAVAGVMAGILLIALRPSGPSLGLQGLLAPGTAWALWTFFTLGTVTFLLKIAVPAAGPIFTIFLIRIGALMILGFLGAAGRLQFPRLGRSRTALLPVAVGVLDTSGFILFNMAILRGSLTVATVLSSLYVVVALVLAWSFLGERLKPHQMVGIAVAVAATVFLLTLLSLAGEAT
jgi:uncharacterized membrane protein